MNKRDTHAFANQMVIYFLVLMCCSGSVGLGTVWLRHQISVSANRTRQIEARIAEVERHLSETLTLIETEQGPDVLKRRNAEWHLGLVLPREDSQVFRVSDDAGNRLAAKNNVRLFDRPLVSLNLPAPVATPVFASLSQIEASHVRVQGRNR
jgi:hypothetical protein